MWHREMDMILVYQNRGLKFEEKKIQIRRVTWLNLKSKNQCMSLDISFEQSCVQKNEKKEKHNALEFELIV